MEAIQELNEKGFIFKDANDKIYRCCLWGDSAWLFLLMPDHLWVSVKRLSQMDIWMLPHNLSDEEQQWYYDMADQAQANFLK